MFLKLRGNSGMYAFVRTSRKATNDCPFVTAIALYLRAFLLNSLSFVSKHLQHCPQRNLQSKFFAGIGGFVSGYHIACIFEILLNSIEAIIDIPESLGDVIVAIYD
jgi:hypothetical protein